MSLRDLFHLFDSTGSGNTDRRLIEKLTYGSADVGAPRLDESLITNLIWLLIAEYRTDEEMQAAIPNNAFDRIEETANMQDSEEFIIQLGNGQSTEWDAALKRATPDTPNHLIDVARELSRQVDAFPKLWSRLCEILSEQEFASFTAWLNLSSQRLTGKNAVDLA
ncbi:hypothetical protein Q9L58_010723 [Maublancomyces gigas]|uniref:Uncharacterized protein n=1 Tax=Discina gigas TaxID=1032678 RepID=A0ABR3G3R4_9PEZI